jgi:hypothetical protein
MKEYMGYIRWDQFVKDIYARFEIDTHFLGMITKLCKINRMEDFIIAFKILEIIIEGMNLLFKKCFINGLEEEIKA